MSKTLRDEENDHLSLQNPTCYHYVFVSSFV